MLYPFWVMSFARSPTRMFVAEPVTQSLNITAGFVSSMIACFSYSFFFTSKESIWFFSYWSAHARADSAGLLKFGSWGWRE